MSRIGRMIRSAKTKAITPPKLMPPFQSTAASGTLPIEQTKESIATTGPISGPQRFATSGWLVRKSDRHHESGTHAASAPAISSPPTRFVEASSNAIAAVKSAPLRNSDRASATDAYEHDDDAIPRADAVASERGESSGRSRSTRRFETSACTIADSRKPRTSAQRI